MSLRCLRFEGWKLGFRVSGLEFRDSSFGMRFEKRERRFLETISSLGVNVQASLGLDALDDVVQVKLVTLVAFGLPAFP